MSLHHPQVDIVIPVYNEAHVLAFRVRELDDHLREHADFSYVITIADNASSDVTLAVARRLERELDSVRAIHLDRRGRGRALRAAWSASDADVLAYMDVDLSTGLDAFGDLVAPLLEGRGDLAIGSRLAPGASVRRSARRELISRAYNILLRLSLELGVADAQCGFKAGRREVIQALLPAVADEEWFFDTELLHAARRRAFSVREIPVRWVEDRDSRVRILATARADLRGIARLRRAQRARRAAPSGHARWQVPSASR
jgi:glycosyltransferase involved in cell wall biosynthesis